ncbi:MAG: hypothetical protein J6A63_00985 [Clostridia bacterium]|nr:hypothetical protein [Clostridia bacterium]
MMETILERVTTQQQTAQQEAERHNALIKERYKRLQDAEASQFAANTQTNATEYTVRASVLTPSRPVEETPAIEQAPQVTEYVREKIDSPVFTTEKFQAIEQQPIMQAPTYAPVEIQTTQTAVAVEEQYSLTQFAKMVIAAFAAAVIVMLTLICVNTQLIRFETTQLQAAQTRNVQLQEEYAKVQQRIEDATSQETILEYAQSNGMIQK